MKCSPSVLCQHSYVTDRDDVNVDRESRDLQRIACLSGADIIVTHGPESVRFMHMSGGWIEHDGESITHVEVMLFKAYNAIEMQLNAGDYSLLLGEKQAELAELTEPEYKGQLHESIEYDIRMRAYQRVVELMETVTRRHLSALAARIMVYAQDSDFYDFLHRLPATEFDMVKIHPVIPLAAGGAIDLSPDATRMGKSGILVPEDYGLLHRTHRDRGAIDLDPDVLTKGEEPELDLPRRLLETHYPPEFVELAAYLLAYPADDIISVLIGDSGTGKTTFWQWVGWATGSVEVSDVSLLTSRSQFTPLESALARSHVVVLDEGDALKSAPIPFGQLNKATAERFDVNVKYGAYHPGVPRLGALVLIGNDWPSFDSTTPGLSRRIAWAWDTPLPARIDKAVYDALSKSKAAHRYMLAVLISRARVLRAMGVEAARETLLTDAVLQARQRMVDATTSPVKQALDDVLESGGPEDYVTAKRVREMLQEADVGRLSNQELKRVMAMYGASSERVRINGERVRAWRGVRETDSAPERSNGKLSHAVMSRLEAAPQPQIPCAKCAREGAVLTDELLCADTVQCEARREAMIRTGEWI